MKTVSIAIGAGASIKQDRIGAYFHLLETTGPVDVKFYRNGAIFAEASGMEGGFYSSPRGGFDAFEIYSASAQTVKAAVSDGTGGYNRTTGTVQVSNLSADQGAFTQATATVTSASAQLLAANAARRCLLVQNNHATGNIFVTIDGTAATTAKGIKITPGSLILLDVFAPSGQINAIGDIASNNAVVVIWG